MDDALNSPSYKNINQPAEIRAEDLISRMTIAEKISQLIADSAAVERLGIPAYNWWNEALHGIARAGTATVFPQAIGIAATWNEDLVQRMANAISDEGRAKYHQAMRKGHAERYHGLTFWSPNINIFRDPRWGRGQETSGEDPYLTGRMGVQFVRGMQGDHPQYLKTAACAKHFAVHSGPEAVRHQINVQVSERDLLMTYLPAFESLVKEGQVAGVMGAYNRVNGEACCASRTLLQEILRKKWGFEGYIVSDYGAINDIYEGHHLADTPDEAAAMALQAGCQLDSADTFEHLLAAVGKGLFTEKDIDLALTSLFIIQFRLGMFDPDKAVPFANIPVEAIDSSASQALSLEVARQSVVLLKNENDLLPLNKHLASIAVIGPNADDDLVLLGNYFGKPSETVTVLEGIKGVVSPSTEILTARGCDILDTGQDGFDEAIRAAEKAEVVIVVMGLSQRVEGEEGQTEGNLQGSVSLGDRETLDLPGEQEALLKALAKTGKPIVLVLLNGSALSINWADEHIPAILEAWYPGQAGGRAVAQVLFGDYNPGGRLPVTFYRSVEQLPPFDDYAMKGRTYRYFDGKVLYPFGFGLSYTTFNYRNLALSHDRMVGPEVVRVSCEVENIGDVTGDEVAQVYLRDEESQFPRPRHTLVGFKRIRLAPGAVERINFEINPRQFAVVNERGEWILEPGLFTITVGSGQPGTPGCLSASVELVGETVVLE
jgi:beta-glucosidase